MRSIMSSPTRRSVSVCCARSRATAAMARARARRSETSGSTDGLRAPTGINAGPVVDHARLSCRNQPTQVWPIGRGCAAAERQSCRADGKARTIRSRSIQTMAMQSTSTSKGPCQADTQMKLRAGGSEGKYRE
jgi:hypothetical protein